MAFNNLVEMHCHILPGIDDGAKHLETSLKMIARLQEQGVKKIVLTPHYYSDTISLDDFLRQREKAYNRLVNALPSGSPELIPAAEVYISDYLFNNKNLDDLKIGNSKYILIEHPFSNNFSEKTYDRLMNLYCDYGARPILAHIERYPALMSDTNKLASYIEMGCLTQVNISSFVSSPRKLKKHLLRLLDEGFVYLVGTDCHNMDSRPPEFEYGLKEIEKKYGRETVEMLIANSNAITE